MIKKRLLLALPILVALAGGAAAQKSVVGRYNVEGRTPDGGALVNENGIWSGIWTFAGGTRLGQERWVRR